MECKNNPDGHEFLENDFYCDGIVVAPEGMCKYCDKMRDNEDGE